MSTNASDAPGGEEKKGLKLPKILSRRSSGDEPPRQRINDERIRELILALGDVNHPQHSTAINELVALGSAAVGPLCAALAPDRPWLTAYRSAEALAQIGDGSASGALMGALRHPNSNVRWSAVRALAEVGDTRTLWALRRVAHEDRGKTSWGESVSDTAQLALDRLQSRSALLRFSEPVKTALVFVTLLAAVLFATNRVQAMLAELRREVPAPVVVAGPDTTAVAEATTTAEAAADVTVVPTIVATPSPTRTSENIGTVAQGGNVRSGPSVSSPRIGSVNPNDEIIFLAVSGDWYRVKLGAKHSPNSIINGTGEGWVSSILVNRPTQPVPTERPTRP